MSDLSDRIIEILESTPPEDKFWTDGSVERLIEAIREHFKACPIIRGSK